MMAGRFFLFWMAIAVGGEAGSKDPVPRIRNPGSQQLRILGIRSIRGEASRPVMRLRRNPAIGEGFQGTSCEGMSCLAHSEYGPSEAFVSVGKGVVVGERERLGGEGGICSICSSVASRSHCLMVARLKGGAGKGGKSGYIDDIDMMVEREMARAKERDEHLRIPWTNDGEEDQKLPVSDDFGEEGGQRYGDDVMEDEATAMPRWKDAGHSMVQDDGDALPEEEPSDAADGGGGNRIRSDRGSQPSEQRHRGSKDSLAGLGDEFEAVYRSKASSRLVDRPPASGNRDRGKEEHPGEGEGEGEEAPGAGLTFNGTASKWGQLAALVDKLIEREELDAAEELLEKTLEESPNDAGPMLLYAEFVWTCRHDEGSARELYEAACKAEPKSSDVHSVRGQFLRQIRDREGAVGALREAASLADPDGGDATVWYNLGHLLQELGMEGAPGANSEAEKAYRTAMSIEPDHERTYAQLANLMFLQGRNITEAEELFVKALRVWPNNTVALIGYARLLRQKLEYDKADIMYQSAFTILLEDGEEGTAETGMHLMGEYATFLAENVGPDVSEQADQIFKGLAEQDALDEPGGHAYVALLFKLGRGAEAVELLTSITRGDEEADEPQGWAHAVLGDALLRSGDPKGARRAYRTGLKLQPLCLGALDGMCVMMRPDHVDDIDTMEELFEAASQAAEAGPRQARTRLAIARAEFAARQTGPRALLSLEIIEEDMKDGAAESAAAILCYSRLLLKLGEVDRGVAVLRTAHDLRPDDADVLVALGDALLQHKDGVNKEAGACYEEAATLAPRNLKAHQGLGVVHMREGHWEEAKAELRLVAEDEPHNLVAARTLGLLLAERSTGPEEYNRAVELLKKVQKADPDDEAVWNALYPYTRMKQAGNDARGGDMQNMVEGKGV